MTLGGKRRLGIVVLVHQPMLVALALGQHLVNRQARLEVVASAAIVPAGTPSGGVSVFNQGPATADVILDLNGYFGAPPGLKFYPVSPCRLADTRGTSAGFTESLRSLGHRLRRELPSRFL